MTKKDTTRRVPRSPLATKLLKTLQAAFAPMLGAATKVRTQVDCLAAKLTTLEFIFEFETTMYHVKCMVIDNLWTSVGSANCDNRSFRLNQEANLNFIGREVAATETCFFDEDKARPREVTYKTKSGSAGPRGNGQRCHRGALAHTTLNS